MPSKEVVEKAVKMADELSEDAGWSQDEIKIDRDVRRVTMQAFFLA